LRGRGPETRPSPHARIVSAQAASVSVVGQASDIAGWVAVASGVLRRLGQIEKAVEADG
jgi:hypothetical protein